MRIPYSWLKEFVAVTDTPEKLAHRLTMAGLEVEEIAYVGDDTIFEVNVTPNRADCLSVIGIAREVAALYDTKVTFPNLSIVSEPKELNFNVDILDTDLCSRYAGRIVHNVQIGPSPEWMKDRLEKCGIRSINNVVDVTNYVLLEFGHPLHAFDLNRLNDYQIKIGTPASLLGTSEPIFFTTLDGVKRSIEPDMLLIWDGEKPVAIAGIMGGSESEVSDGTRDIFIESAWFNPGSIRRTSRRLGLKTEASYRFERGTDIKIMKKSLDRAALLIKELAHGNLYGKIDIYPKRWSPPEIYVRYSRVNQVLGTSLTKTQILDCLKKLELDISQISDTGFVVKPPAFRRDITMEVDIIEEVARLFGFDNIAAELPRMRLGSDDVKTDVQRMMQLKQKLRNAFLFAGYTETINYSFIGESDLDRLGLSADDYRRHTVHVQNPLSEDGAVMRTCLLPSLLRNVITNVSQGIREFKLFEQSRVFLPCQGQMLPKEYEHFAALLYREKLKNLYPDNTHDFFKMKGVLEDYFADMHITDVAYQRSAEPYLHPGQSADVMVAGERIGSLGVFSPLLMNKLEIKSQNPSIVLLELDLTVLLSHFGNEPRYRPIIRFPFVDRDTALVVDADVPAREVLDLIQSFNSDVIEESAIFDVYQGDSIGVGKKSIAFRIRYRAADRTLTDEEVEAIHKSLVTYIAEKTGGKIRQ